MCILCVFYMCAAIGVIINDDDDDDDDDRPSPPMSLENQVQ